MASAAPNKSDKEVKPEIKPEASPNKPEASPNKPEASPNKPEVTPNKPEVTPNKPEVTPNKPQKPEKPENKSEKPENNAKEKEAKPKVPLTVSHLKYWREGDDPANANTNEGKDGASFLSYNTFVLLSLLGGYIALDHLYLRSPWTFVAKIGVNLFFFGAWWIWDAAQALFNEDTVRLYGLSIPLVDQRVGAGFLVKDIPDKKHFRFFTYAAALIFGGLIGLDSFLVGQTEFGLFRLICTITFIFLPISMIEWVYKMYQFFVNTKDVVEEHANFFGASQGPSAADRFSGWFYTFLQSFLGPVITPITSTIDKGLDAYDKTLSVVDTTIKTGSDIISGVGKIINASSKASSVMPGLDLYSSITGPALEGAKQKGGNLTADLNQLTQTANKADKSLNLLPFTLIGTVLLVIVTGFYKNYSKKDAQKDDAPPNPSAVSSTPPRSAQAKAT